MSKNNGTPDWQKMLDYNQIDSTQKQKFLKEAIDESVRNIVTKLSDAVSLSMRQGLHDAVKKLLNYEDRILEAAVVKRFGSVEAAAATGMTLEIRQDNFRPSRFESLSNKEYAAVLPDNTHIPLVSITTRYVHDEARTEYTSFVGDLKL